MFYSVVPVVIVGVEAHYVKGQLCYSECRFSVYSSGRGTL